jgi:hypothetical protein
MNVIGTYVADEEKYIVLSKYLLIQRKSNQCYKNNEKRFFSLRLMYVHMYVM